MNRRGFTLIEVLVALTLLATSMAALTQTIIAAQRAAHIFATLREAHWMATEAIEQARAGHQVPDLPSGSRWNREIDVQPHGPGLLRVAVHVAHRQDAAIGVRLETMVWRP